MGSQEGKSPVVRLVLFMVCLSIAGAFVAGLHYYAVDQPQQKAVQAPGNASDECRRLAEVCPLSCQYYLGTTLVTSVSCLRRCNEMVDSCNG